MISIELNKLRFFAYHGLYDEEKEKGNEFEVNLTVIYKPVKKKIRSIAETINYVTLYELVKSEMNNPRELLETLAQEITAKIQNQFPSIKEIEISITKLNPPIPDFIGSVGVRYKRQF